jgi:hypothetical protein
MLSKRAEALVQRAIAEAAAAPTLTDARAVRAELESDLEAIGPKSVSDGMRVFDALLHQHTQGLVRRYNSAKRGAGAGAFIGETRMKVFGILRPMRDRHDAAKAAGRNQDPEHLLTVMDAAVRDALRDGLQHKHTKEEWAESLRYLEATYRGAGGRSDRRIPASAHDTLVEIFPAASERRPQGKVISISPTVRRRVANPSPKKRKSRKGRGKGKR